MEETANGVADPAVHAATKPQYAFENDSMTLSASSSTSTSASKAKRKRTSPQDHAVLETAYLNNSKPDKGERAQIVSLVNMTEKEVQIWFQNRRQNDRRRSKPLQPHELVAHLHTRTASPIQVQPTPPSLEGVQPASFLRPALVRAQSDVIARPASRASSIHDLLNPTSSSPSISSQEAVHDSQDTAEKSTPPSSFEDHTTVTPTEDRAQEVDADLSRIQGEEEMANSEHGSARKRDHDEMTGADTKGVDATGDPTKAPARVKEPLARSSSTVRLAMTVDGAVKVRTNDEPTPSPEKPRTAPPSSQVKTKSALARSKSAMNSVEVFRESSQGAQSKAGFGRSRDARTWEFYCDSNAKDALSTQAEAETTGSAVGAINLLRTNSLKSRTKALSPSVTKTNSRLAPSSKDDKPKLSRAKSSLGRLQGLDGATDEIIKKGKQSGHARSPSDSDKENWAPGTQLSEHALRRTQPSGRQRPILQVNEEMIFPDASSSRKRRDGVLNPQRSPTKEKAKGDDLDCVKSLLSLSQGAWS
ncbi:hypothetical protein EDD37DRAFT_343272 [Exophiala viscosa]|uniref:Homeobox domain-containing protein n=1 Tax=Exophiala viscosa TaxID=2486360 RepID=A0AAN6DYK6_9EURO|nr:hypothetical protein EDD36DRAFT_261169 [Exophiala viscosa]KAI1626369.1 hypothetical protein EDD37DRAFT_343272 [Exophiala viscosa]